MSEVQRADPGARRRAVLLVLGAAALGTVLIVAVERYSEPLREWVLSEPDKAPTRLKLLFFLFAAGASAPLLAFSMYLWTFGNKIARARRFPPPGQHVVADTPIVEGEAAMSRARALKVIAVTVALMGVLFWFLLWRLAALLRPAA